jgi:uncharacterized protein YggU (UPF0235/DUF167 family)
MSATLEWRQPLPACCRETPDGIAVTLRVTPNAGENRIIGPVTRDDGSTVLAVRVRAVPDRGRANAAVIALLAGALSCPKSAISVTAGRTARTKTLAIAGPPAALVAAFAALLRQ